MLQWVSSVGNVGTFLERAKRREEKPVGFGHRLYRNYDPSARIIRQVAHELFWEIRGELLIAVALELKHAALEDELFKGRKLFPNCDFYYGLVYRRYGSSRVFSGAVCAGAVRRERENIFNNAPKTNGKVL